MSRRSLLLLLPALIVLSACAGSQPMSVSVSVSQGRSVPLKVAALEPDDLVEYEDQPQAVQQLIQQALSLTWRDLDYRYGSNSPESGGMDCSGTVQHALAGLGVRVPRSSYTQYHWARERGVLTQVSGVHSADHPALAKLSPGDLMFWTGTYSTAGRSPAISHVMIYLGTLKSDGLPVMVGASDGRRFRGRKINGVSVFDFKLPSRESKARFVAFGPVPGLR